MSLIALARRSCVGAYCEILSKRFTYKLIHTHKMAEKPAEYIATNGLESKTPFLIGVAGGTASGKVRLT